MNIEVIYLVHYCLYFRFNKKKYLLGSSTTLNQDYSALRKLKIDHIILPAFPFNSEHKLFLWCFELLNKIEYQSIVVSDMATKKKIESILAHSPEINYKNWKWQVIKQHQLNQEQLMKIYEDILSKNNRIPLYVQPNGLAFNQLSDHLNFIIPEQGRSILLTNFNDSYLIDPTEKIEQLLHIYGIPFSSLKAIILTKPNLNIFQIIQRQTETDLITTQQIYKEVKKQLKLYFHWDEEILKNRIKGRIMIEQKKSYKYSNLHFSYTQSKSTGIQFLDIVFGLKRVRIYPRQLIYYPSELQNLKDLEYLVVYDIEKTLKNQLQGCPQFYRKKIIYNRLIRKYNNKYFYTFNKNQCHVTVTAHQYLTEQIRNTICDLSFLYKQRDRNRSLSYKQLKNGQKFNASQRIIYLRKGYIKDQKGTLHSAFDKITSAHEIVSLGNAIIMYEPLRNIYFTEKSKLLDKLSTTMGEDLLKRVKQNSFISKLKKKQMNTDPLCFESQNQEEQIIQPNSQWDIFNSVCSLKTFEGGTTLGKPMNLYFIVKGYMKYSNDQKQALKCMGIGNIRKYYSQAYQDTDDIEVVKDTWALQIPIKDLHHKFMCKFPTKIYELFQKSLIFD